MLNRIRRGGIAAALVAMTLSFAPPAGAVNLFSVQQDVQAGRQAASQVERQMPMVRDSQVNNYVNAIVQRLAANAGGPQFQYRARVVTSRELNAFSLPGGFIYVNSGLISAVRSEDELAGVLAHEIAHVAERHGTEQATKAYGAQAGVGLLAGLLGGRDGRVGIPEQIIGSLGVNAAFMKFSRNAEHEADSVGAAMMARAGYDPMAMASFFDLLQQQKRSNPNAVASFFSSHPPASDRSARIRAQASRLERGDRRQVGSLRAVQSRLG